MLRILKAKLFKEALALLFLILFLEFLAEFFYFHWEYWWYDVMLHGLGGFCVSMAFMSFWYYLFGRSIENKRKIILYAFVAVLVVGISWEIFELKIGATELSDGIYYLRDTFSDLLMDLSGGFFGTLFSLNLISKNK
jgi:hypothetical protein